MKDRIFTSCERDEEGKTGDERTLRFKRPTQSVLSKAELTYRSAYSKAFRADIITNAEVEKMLRDRGLWDEKTQEQANGIRDEIGQLELKLDNPGLSNEKGVELCSEITNKRIELMRLNNVYQQIADNTCETMATEARNQLLCVECITDNETGLRVFKDVEEFRSRLSEQLAVDAFRETVIATLEVVVGHTLPSDLTEDYAENKWQRDRGLFDVEVEELEVESAEEVPAEKPKKRRKKTKAS